MINELEGRAPQRVIADVELTCEEEFVLEDGEGRVVHSSESSGPKVCVVLWWMPCFETQLLGHPRQRGWVAYAAEAPADGGQGRVCRLCMQLLSSQ